MFTTIVVASNHQKKIGEEGINSKRLEQDNESGKNQEKLKEIIIQVLTRNLGKFIMKP